MSQHIIVLNNVLLQNYSLRISAQTKKAPATVPWSCGNFACKYKHFEPSDPTKICIFMQMPSLHPALHNFPFLPLLIVSLPQVSPSLSCSPHALKGTVSQDGRGYLYNWYESKGLFKSNSPWGKKVFLLRGLFTIYILTINGGCSIYVPVRSKFEAAVSITWVIWRWYSWSPCLFWGQNRLGL